MNGNQNEETKKCKHCQSDIPKKAKVCPYCNKKQSGVLKWIIIAVVAIIIISAAGGGEDKPTKIESNSTEADVVTEVVAQPESFTVGDTAEYKGIKVTLNSITENIGSQFNKPTDGNVFLLVDFTIENNSNSELNISSLLCFEAYQDGYSTSESFSALMENNGNQLDGTIAPGKKMQGSIGYEVPADFAEFEINFTPDVWSSGTFTFVYKK